MNHPLSQTIQKEKTASYSSSIAHLLDECRRMELLLQLFFKKRKQDPSSDNPYPGLFLSDKEVNDLFSKAPDGSTPFGEIEELLEEFQRLSEEISLKKKGSMENGTYLSLLVLQNTFRLSPFETDILLLCLLPELQKKYEKIYGYLQDDLTQKRPSVALISDILANSTESRAEILRYFFLENSLSRFDLISMLETSHQSSISAKGLSIDERILNYLFEVNDPDPSLSPYTFLRIPKADLENINLDQETKDLLQRIFLGHLKSESGPSKLFIHLKGPYGSGRKSTAEALCRKAGIALLIVDVAELAKREPPFDPPLKKLFREGALQPAAIYFENTEKLFSDDEKSQTLRKAFFRIADEYSWITFFSGADESLQREKILNRNIFMSVELPVPDPLQRAAIWRKTLRQVGTELSEEDLHALANKFKFTRGQILDAISVAKNLIQSKDAVHDKLTIESLYESCRLQSNHKLSSLARKVDSGYTWDDIVLPEDQLEQLHEISNHIKYRNLVYNNWGFDRKLAQGKGLNILFAGPSGTGKTMAASVIANDLGLEMYKIDLSSVVSKYIGETEKNLSKIFAEAETSNAILFFDEADALFGKRSETKDAHDRYANIEINYLLQKMEEYEGVVILATNLSRNIDEAFLRRMQFVVEFPFPDTLQREQLWKTIFPKLAPTSNIDHQFLSEKLKLAGGNIKNIALRSAFFAAKESGEIGMRQIMQAARREYQKLGKPFLKSDFEPYYHLTEGNS